MVQGNPCTCGDGTSVHQAFEGTGTSLAHPGASRPGADRYVPLFRGLCLSKTLKCLSGRKLYFFSLLSKLSFPVR